ncbi:hypothetical protein [Metallosphaera cuprina]|uniref:hypothetical protein n=1 Tax=Metallosphaera cuprina TaxID=1006005 RepID=UPI00064F5CB1|nr:hypothetical protein [Metallosphaera cuprina]
MKSALANNANNKLTFTLITSFLSSIITTILVYHSGSIFTGADNVYPLSPNVFYNYNLFFTNINGGSPAIVNYPPVNNIIAFILLLPFFNQYSQIIDFPLVAFVGNLAISLLIYKNLIRQDFTKVNIYIYFVTILSEILLYTSINLHYIIKIFTSTFFPIFLSFPWIIYFIDSIVNDSEKIFIKIIKVIITALLIIIFINSIPTLILVVYSMLAVLFLSFLAISKEPIKQKIKILVLAFSSVVIFNIIILKLYLSFYHSYTNPEAFTNSQNSFLSILEYCIVTRQGSIGNVLTLSYYQNSIFVKINSIVLLLFSLNTILIIIPFIVKKKLPQALPFLITFLFLSGWLAAPFVFTSFYLNLYKNIPYLWSLDIPSLSFTYFLSLSFSLILGTGLSFLNFRKIIAEVLIILLLIISVGANFSASYSFPGLTRYPTQTQLPSYLYEISNIISSTNVYNPRILIYPLGPAYVAYNFSKSVYVGFGFWYSLLKGDEYSSCYFSNKPGYSLEFFMLFYPLKNLTDLEPMINTMKILGINYVVLTKNFIPSYYYGLYDQTIIQRFENYLKDYPVLFNNSQMTLYHFSNEQAVSPVKYIILVNITGPLWPSSSPSYIPYRLTLLQEALDINFVNYSNAIIIPKSYEGYLLKYVGKESINIANINDNITVIMINNVNAKTTVYGDSPNEFKVKLSVEDKQNYSYVPLIVRYYYYPEYVNYYSGNYSNLIIIPLYGNQTYLLLVKPSSSFTTINFNYTNVYAYIYVLSYPLLLIVLVIYLILRNKLNESLKLIRKLFSRDFKR